MTTMPWCIDGMLPVKCAISGDHLIASKHVFFKFKGLVEFSPKKVFDKVM